MISAFSIIFRVDQEYYGLETRFVKEVIWIPELFQSQSLPTDIAGVCSYRGTVIPVLDLHQGVGGKRRKLRVHDQVVVVEWQKKVLGLLVDKVEEVTSLGVEPVHATSSRATDQEVAGLRVVGFGKFGDHNAKILDPSLVLKDLHASETGALLDSLAEGLLEGKSSLQSDKWIPLSSERFEKLSPEEFDLLRERADALTPSEPVADVQQWITLAVVRFNEELVGLDPLVVREFAEFGDMVPIPCCPDFVLGHMNLRGEIVTVFDLRQVLEIPYVENLPFSKVVVIQLDTCLFGIAVQEVLDCVSCESKNGGGFRIEGEGEGFLNVVSQYQGKELKYLDVSRLISSKALEIYEEV